MKNIATQFLSATIKRMLYYKGLGEKTFEQLKDEDFHYRPNGESNSIAVVIKHMHGNMMSRWTNFLSEDGEKEWRRRDSEFEEAADSKSHLLELWAQGWKCFIDALDALTPDDLLKTITIRSEQLIVIDAIQRQVAHYPYHVGQIVYVGKLLRNQEWKSLSIPRGESEAYNKKMEEKK